MNQKDPFAGIYQILHTPFDDSGDIDWDSFSRQIEYCIKAGVHGLVLPAMASEFFTLSDAERFAVVEFATKEINQRAPVLVGVQAVSLPVALKFAEHAAKHNADGLMAMPPYLRKAPKADVNHYYSELGQFDRPVMIQNAPSPVGTPLAPAELADLLRAEPNVTYVKEETTPILQRISQIQDLAGEACKGVFGGANGLYLIDELQRGACGNMPAGGVVDVQVTIFEQYVAGNERDAETLHFQLLPLLTYASIYGVSFHKTVLWKRGVLASPYARDPQKISLNQDDIDAIGNLWERISAFTLEEYPLKHST